MAEKIDNDNTKHQALLKLAQGRAELSAQAEQLRTDLNPKLAARRVFQQHPAAVVLATFVVGLAVTALVLRSHARAQSERPVRKERLVKEQDKQTGGGFLGGLVRAVTPALIKIAINQPLAQYFAKRQKDWSGSA